MSVFAPKTEKAATAVELPEGPRAQRVASPVVVAANSLWAAYEDFNLAYLDTVIAQNHCR